MTYEIVSNGERLSVVRKYGWGFVFRTVGVVWLISTAFALLGFFVMDSNRYYWQFILTGCVGYLAGALYWRSISTTPVVLDKARGRMIYTQTLFPREVGLSSIDRFHANHAIREVLNTFKQGGTVYNSELLASLKGGMQIRLIWEMNKSSKASHEFGDYLDGLCHQLNTFLN